MADIRPFRGVHYNPARVKDLAKVICPPYDIISPQMQQELHHRSEFNFVRIEYGFELPHDSTTENKYARAAAAMADWLEKSVLVKDVKPGIYIDEHTFTYRGKTRRRHSINCLVKLEDWSKKVIRPHEGTLSKAKSDRLNMLWALHANTSPIMSLYEDKTGDIKKLLDQQMKQKPLLKIDNVDGENHRIWAVAEEDTIVNLHHCLAEQPFYIADGHHRYESALNYQRERNSTASSVQAEEPYDFVMMTLLDMADPGLVILPAHRMINGLTAPDIERLKERLPAFFNMEKVDIERSRLQEQVDQLLDSKDGPSRMVICGLDNDRLVTLTLRDADSIRTMFPAFHTEFYKTLDVSIVDHVIMEELLGIAQDKMGSYLNWVHDPVLAVEKVHLGEYQLGIIVNPVKPEAIKTIADSGDRMPKKSTYFYPKVPAGLVSYRF